MPLFSQIMAFTLQTYTIFGKFHLIKTTHINLIILSSPKGSLFSKKKNQNYFIFYNKIHIFESAYLLTNKK